LKACEFEIESPEGIIPHGSKADVTISYNDDDYQPLRTFYNICYEHLSIHIENLFSNKKVRRVDVIKL
jgi:hypothetical protein